MWSRFRDERAGRAGVSEIAALPKLYTEAELAAYLGVHPETIGRERRRGRLGYTRIGSKIRFTSAHVEAYLRDRECATTSKPAQGSGTSAGPMLLDARSAHQLAREIGAKRNSRSPAGR